MWVKDSFLGLINSGTRYESPSATHKNYFSPFHQRKFTRVNGPLPVIMNGRYTGLDKRQWFNPDIAERRTFRVHYGYNPRCLHKGTWGKPGHGHWMHDWWVEAVAKRKP